MRAPRARALVAALAIFCCAGAGAGESLDSIHFDNWGKWELSLLERAPWFLSRDELLAIPIAPPVANSDGKTRADLDELLRLQAARTPAQLRAIEAHRAYDGLCEAFFELLKRDMKKAPKTRALLEHVDRDGTLPLFTAKRRFERARPTQLEPRLKNAIAIPRHAAYPSGHALQGNLVAHVMAELAPASRDAIAALGVEVGHEREIAGLHYAGDSAASRALGDAIWARLIKNEKFRKELDDARAEWR